MEEGVSQGGAQGARRGQEHDAEKKKKQAGGQKKKGKEEGGRHPRKPEDRGLPER